MTKPADRAMNEMNRPPLSDCQQQIDFAMSEFRENLHIAARVPETLLDTERESIEADLCLTSRSAYFDFYTWVVLNGTIDRAAELELDQLFRRALELMRAGKFKVSVQERYEEFREQCAQVRLGNKITSKATSLDARDQT